MQRNKRPVPALVLLACLVPAAALAEGERTFEQAAARVQDDLDKSLAELAAVRQRIADEKLPLARRLRQLEERLSGLRAESQDAARTLDARNLELGQLQTSLRARHEEQLYLSNFLDEYVRNLETRVHITELQRYRDLIERARLSPEERESAPGDVYAAQLAVVEASLDRLLELSGGTTFPGSAVAENGELREATFALIGPVAVYRTADGSSAGLVEQRLGSLEPHMVSLDPALADDVRGLVAAGRGRMPFDPTLGNALRVEQTEETLLEHVSKGGPVMIPILLLALAALVVAVTKWVQIARVRIPSSRRVQAVLDDLRRGDRAAAARKVAAISGPTGAMLQAGVEHADEPRDLVEEVMYEKVLETRLRLQSFLPFVGMSASAAPLLGLLGTVTGMINTFKLISVFGTGDAKTLSSGISEALVTTEFGLIVAIPSLLLYAYLSRRVRRLIDGMERTAVAYLNRVSTGRRGKPAEPAREAPRVAVAQGATERLAVGS